MNLLDLPRALAAADLPTGAAAAGATGDLTAADKHFLLTLARRVIMATAAGERAPTPEEMSRESDQVMSPALMEKRGAFVTLTDAGRLCGCIGYIEGISPLAAAVADNAIAAASRDPRFTPLNTDEVAGIQIEISALTPLQEIPGPEAIVIGQHGIVLKKGMARAVFLPQVAPEQGWDLETTLQHLALKAGLPLDGWREDASFQVFEAEIFAEASA